MLHLVWNVQPRVVQGGTRGLGTAAVEGCKAAHRRAVCGVTRAVTGVRLFRATDRVRRDDRPA